MRFGMRKQLPLTLFKLESLSCAKLRRALRPNEIRSREIRELIQQMKETMYAAPGVGLAAPQIDRAFSWQ